MFIRIKKSKNSPKCSVQIVESKRVDVKVKQRIITPTSTPNFSKTLIPRATLKPSLPKINLPVPHLLC